MIYDINENISYKYSVFAFVKETKKLLFILNYSDENKEEAEEQYNELVEKYKDTLDVVIQFVDVEEEKIIKSYDTTDEIC